MKRIAAIVLSVCMMIIAASGVFAAEESYAAAISSVTVGEDNTVQSVQLSAAADGDYTAYAAVYDKNGVLVNVDTAKVSGTTAVFEGGITFDESTQVLKCYIWDENMVPAAETYTSGSGETDGYNVTFETDGNVSVTVSSTKSFDNADDLTENAAVVTVPDGDDQINFMVVLEDGYAVDAITVTPANYKNIKDPTETGIENAYRITKITGDITVTITTKEDDGSGEAVTGGGIIRLLGTSIDTSEAEGASADGTTLTISLAGEYTIDGTLDDGNIVVAAPKSSEVILNLDNVSVTSTTEAAPFSASNGKITLYCKGDVSFTDSSANTDKACLYSKQDLTIKTLKSEENTASLTVNGNASKGIRCGKDIEIGNCDVTVNSQDDGIRGDKSVKLTKNAANVTVTTAYGDGIKSNDAPALDEITGELDTGIVTVNGGTVTVTTGSMADETGTVTNGDGIQASALVEIKNSKAKLNINAAGEAIKANASSVADGTIADGDGVVDISAGTIVASAGEDGIKAAKKVTVSGSADVTITKAQEGIQVKEIVYTDETETTVSGYIEGEIEITGGTVNITCSEDGIQCGTGDVVISGGDITVSAQNDCIQAENILEISGGTFNLTAHGGVKGSATEDSCKGLKAQNLIDISDGTINIDSYDDSVHSNHTINISGGAVTAKSTDDGVHADSFLVISGDANINVTQSYEGIEAAEIYISGGETRVVSSDDGANASGDEPSDEAYNLTTNRPELAVSSSVTTQSVELMAGPAGPGGQQPGGNWGGGGVNPGMDDSSKYGYLEVSGGLLYIEAEGDGFDTNKDGVISGGTVLVNGPTSGGNGVFDIGEENGGTLKITGDATVIGAGTSDMAVTPDSSSQYYVVAALGSSQSGGMGRGGQGGGAAYTGAVKLTNSNGDVITYVPSKSYSWVFVSTPEMTNGSYTLYYNGSVSGGTSWVGNYEGTYGIVTGGTYSGSTQTSVTATK